jgi:transcriptional regulator with XRE-family HTH domain
MTTEPAKTHISVTGEVYELADPSEVEAMVARSKAMTPGELIIAHRRCMGLKQFEAAARLGVSTQMLSQWENDRLLPSHAKAREIAEKLEMPVVAFVQRVARAWFVRDGVDDLLDVVPLDGTHRQTTKAGTAKGNDTPNKLAKKGKATPTKG